MKKILSTLTLIFFISIYCDAQGTWIQKASMPALSRWGGISFSIGNKGYVGTGKTSWFDVDLWEWDQITNTWTQKANLPGGARASAVGFSIGNKGYVGTGTQAVETFQDFWAFDPDSNSWTQKADFGGAIRAHATGFSIGEKGYIGMGRLQFGTDYSDFWEYDPAMDTWTQKASFGGGMRDGLCSFAVGSKAYAGLGSNATNVKYNDWWSWDTLTNVWSQKASLPDTARNVAACFVIGKAGYICCGAQDAATLEFLDEVWKYNTITNTWTKKASFPGGKREVMTSFSIGAKGYIGTGTNINSVTYNDLWEFSPDTLTGIDEITTDALDIFPNPSSGKFAIHLMHHIDGQIAIYDLVGKVVFEDKIINQSSKEITLKNVFPGIYFVTIFSEGKSFSRKIVIE